MHVAGRRYGTKTFARPDRCLLVASGAMISSGLFILPGIACDHRRRRRVQRPSGALLRGHRVFRVGPRRSCDIRDRRNARRAQLPSQDTRSDSAGRAASEFRRTLEARKKQRSTPRNRPPQTTPPNVISGGCFFPQITQIPQIPQIKYPWRFSAYFCVCGDRAYRKRSVVPV